MTGDGDREFLDQHAEFIDLADDRLDAVGACGICRHHPALDGSEPAPELGDLTREVSGAARQIRDLAADVGAVAQPHRHRIVENQEGQRGERHDRGFGSADARYRIQDQTERRCDQHHADGDENCGNADHVARKALKSPGPVGLRETRKLFAPGCCASPSGATLALMLIREASVVLARLEPPVPTWPRSKANDRMAGIAGRTSGFRSRRLLPPSGGRQPSNVAAKIRPAPISLLFRAGRRCVFIRRQREERRTASGTRCGVAPYATARITLATFSMISPIWSSVTISGGVRASVSPATRSIRSLSWKALFSPSKPRLPGKSGRGARSMPAVRPTVRMSTTFGSPLSDITASANLGSSLPARSNSFSSR